MKKTQSPAAASHRRPAFLTRSACALGLLLLASLCAPAALASEVYAYLGSNYTTTSGVYTPSDYIFGDFTTSTQLAGGLVNKSGTPLSFAFGDGVYDWRSSDSYTAVSFEVSTDASGTPTAVTIDLTVVINYISGQFCAVCQLKITPTGDSVSVSDGTGSNTTAGKWGPDFDPPTPEPASAVLTLAALIAFAFPARKRITRSIMRMARGK